MMWILTVLAAAWVGKILVQVVVRRRPVFTYRCKACGEYIIVKGAGIISAPCPACSRVNAGKVYDASATAIYKAGQRRLEAKAQVIAFIAAGALAGFLYGFFSL